MRRLEPLLKHALEDTMFDRLLNIMRGFAIPVLASLSLVLTVAGGTALAQIQTAPLTTAQQMNDHDINRTELNNFDEYLDNHPGVHRQLNQNPSLINNPQYLSQHPHLQNFLNNHPGVREESAENPGQFIHRENQFMRRGGDISRGELARFDNGYLDKHPRVAQQLNRNPRLVDNPNYLRRHPQLAGYLRNHPEIRLDIRQHPYAFQRRERQYERHEGMPPHPRPMRTATRLR
ncbi:MAG TPA: hypothetical protein VKV79_02140 [Terriglobia bacterium]|nr:hypothetical protein [Terriglobia bacterium]